LDPPTALGNSQSDPEKGHLVQALRFELGKVDTVAIRERMLGLLAEVDKTLAARGAEGLGLGGPKKLVVPMNMWVPADGDVKDFQPRTLTRNIGSSPALS